MSGSSSPAPATGSPRAMAEQGILRIIWPPDGRIPWEERHKMPPIERALNHLLDVVEGTEAPQTTSISVQESQALTEKAVALRQKGMKLRQIADITGLTEKAVSSRISAERKKQTLSRVRTGQLITFDGRPVLCSAAPMGQESRENPRDLSPNSGNIMHDISGDKETPPADDATLRSAANHIVEADKMVTEDDTDGRPPLSSAQKQEILDRHVGGQKPKSIAVVMGLDGRRVQGVILAHEKAENRRKTAENVPVVQSSDILAKPAKDVMLLQQPKEPEKASTDPEGKRPEPKSISRAELDQKVWVMHKAGKDPDKISDELCAEGLYYGSGTVRARLIAQGAKI